MRKENKNINAFPDEGFHGDACLRCTIRKYVCGPNKGKRACQMCGFYLEYLWHRVRKLDLRPKEEQFMVDTATTWKKPIPSVYCVECGELMNLVSIHPLTYKCPKCKRRVKVS